MKKSRTEFRFKRSISKLSMCLWFIDIFPVFDEFLPYLSFYLPILTFFTQCKAMHWKNSRRFALFATFFTELSVRFESYQYFALFRGCLGDFYCLWLKKQHIFSIFLVSEGERIETFGHNIYHWKSIAALLNSYCLISYII